MKFEDDQKNEELLNKMREQNIQYKITDRGSVMYHIKDTASVRGIERKVRFGNELKSNVFESAVLVNENIEALYIEEFKKAGLHYQISTFEGVKQISWSQKISPEVDKIIQKVDEKTLEISIEKATNKANKH